MLDSPKIVKSAIPKKRQELLRWDGWGYIDSKITPVPGPSKGDEEVCFTGNRYPVGGNVLLPHFASWVRKNFDRSVGKAPDTPVPTELPDSILVNEFYNEIKSSNIEHSIEGMERYIRSHGQTIFEIIEIRKGIIKRIPDIVLWPKNHDEVVKIVKLANEFEVVLIPFGGGTSVTKAVSCPEKETRSIAVVDTSQMNKLLWLDKGNLVACFESGIVGQDLENVLQAKGLTMGHEPDSIEFSTLGGWVSTRASGMKKNVYGNIEDIVLKIKMVTCKGVLEAQLLPRVSTGPDINHIMLGSEGMFGIITEVTVKVRPVPKEKRYGSLVFPDFETGIKCLREIAKKRCQPASIRLIDNEQFKFGQALKLDNGIFEKFIDGIKMFLLKNFKGYDPNKIAVATLLFEGDKEEVDWKEEMIYDIAKKFRGINAGAKNGERGYVLTYVIAYIRDFALDGSIVGDSFETSVSWSKIESLCRNVKAAVNHECKKMGIKYHLISCRVTQTYDTGACVYFYFGYKNEGDRDPINTFEHLEHIAREEILASGGSLSHHHGIGKIRSKWYKQSVSEIGAALVKATKLDLDPKNIFALRNLLPEDEQENLYKSKL